jgi:hypothetical protein
MFCFGEKVEMTFEVKKAEGASIVVAESHEIPRGRRPIQNRSAVACAGPRDHSLQ